MYVGYKFYDAINSSPRQFTTKVTNVQECQNVIYKYTSHKHIASAVFLSNNSFSSDTSEIHLIFKKVFWINQYNEILQVIGQKSGKSFQDSA